MYPEYFMWIYTYHIVYSMYLIQEKENRKKKKKQKNWNKMKHIILYT